MSKYGKQNTPNEVMILIGLNVRAIRKENKLTQQDLATKSGVGITALKKFEKTGKISLESLLKLSNTLNRLYEFESILKTDDLGDKNKLFDI
jgi:transcriptional regulator with XRE-family HTH domain